MNQYTGKKISSFQERFTELCDSSPQNDTAIANALHVSKPTISSWKSGVRSPKQPTAIAIADYFNVNVAWLLGYDVVRGAVRKLGQREIPIVVPDSERFVKLVHYMPQSDYIMVMEAFSRAEKKMREAEENK